MRLKDFIAAVERTAPKELAAEWDNPGLLVSPAEREIKDVLMALDCTAAVADEAAERGCQLVLSHHPLFFHPVKHLLQEDPRTAAAWTLARRGVGLYAAHTNLDSAENGVNDVLCGLFGITDAGPYCNGMGRVGTLQKAVTLKDFVRDVNDLLGGSARFTGDPETLVARVAVLGGAGGDALTDAKAAGADVLLTGEARHHEALASVEIGLPLIVAGHYETENIVILPWIRRLQRETNDVQYHVARAGANPFVRIQNREVET